MDDTTSAGGGGDALEVGDVCPGIEYRMQKQKKETVLQVNVSDCHYELPAFTAHRGVVYGLCGSSVQFCRLHAEAPRGLYVRATVERLVYWCDSGRASFQIADVISSQLSFQNTRLSLVCCLDTHMTHSYLICDPLAYCGETTFFVPVCPFFNVSGRTRLEMAADTMKTPHTVAMYTCDDGITTLHYNLVCNSGPDCPDNSDESFCQHPLCAGFSCNSGQCVSASQRFNNFADCFDSSDELGISRKDPVSYPAASKLNCGHQLFYISLDGAGYFSHKLMNSNDSCPGGHYQCMSETLYCLPIYTRCNGYFECLHGDDEEDCEMVTCAGLYRCLGSTICLHGDHLCDGWSACPRWDDELMCDSTCPEGCLCQGRSFLCGDPFPAESFPQIRYLDAAGSGMVPAELQYNIYLIYVSLSSCCLVNISDWNQTNLQLAGICMGCHVIIAVIADGLFHGIYIQTEKIWINSLTCKVDGFLFILSLEASVFVIWFITLDHTIVLWGSRESWRFQKRSVVVVSLLLWLVAALLSVIPFLPTLSHLGVHGQTGLCRLASLDHWSSRHEFTWLTLIAVINFIFCSMTATGQVIIRRRIPKYRTELDPSKKLVFSSVHVMGKVTVVDVLRWFSFGFVTLSASQGYRLVEDVHDIMVVYVLPLNSAINPLLLIWALVTQHHRQTHEERILKTFKARLSVPYKRLHHIVVAEVQEIVKGNQGITVEDCTARCDALFDLATTKTSPISSVTRSAPNNGKDDNPDVAVDEAMESLSVASGPLSSKPTVPVLTGSADEDLNP
ncbi:hypothetical protein ACOMHN_026651 [Nucella lapillus]